MLKDLRHIEEIGKGIYSLPLNEDFFMLYMPEKGSIICLKKSITKDNLNKICEQLFSTNNTVKTFSLVDSPEQYTTLSIIPTLNCNFNCKYCYSVGGRSSVKLSQEKLFGALDWFVRQGRNSRNNLLIMISGGGEPLLAYDIVDRTLEYGNTLAKKRGCNLSFMLITNASLVNKETAKTLSSYHCNVCVSFEILPEIQMSWRRDYEKTLLGINNLISEGVNVSFNSTITADSVRRMEEMVITVKNNFPSVKSLVFEPVVDSTYFNDLDFMASFFEDYLYHYFKAAESAKEIGISLTFSLNDRISSIRARHCSGKFVLTPSGEISSCQCVSSPRERFFNDVKYGNVNDQGIVEIDHSAFSRIIKSYALAARNECSSCFARFVCGGGCPNRRRVYSTEQFNVLCEFTRNFLWMSLARLCKKDIIYD